MVTCLPFSSSRDTHPAHFTPPLMTISPASSAAKVLNLYPLRFVFSCLVSPLDFTCVAHIRINYSSPIHALVYRSNHIVTVSTPSSPHRECRVPLVSFFVIRWALCAQIAPGLIPSIEAPTDTHTSIRFRLRPYRAARFAAHAGVSGRRAPCGDMPITHQFILDALCRHC